MLTEAAMSNHSKGLRESVCWQVKISSQLHFLLGQDVASQQ